MAGLPPRQVYQALVNAGASTVQAIGIMANMINESGFDPEAVGDQGTSFGLVQQHGGQYSSLVTGNPQADMAAQIRVVALNGGFRAASGSTPAEAAGNFASGYEGCVGCQPGGAQYSGRVGNASTVAGWVSSGNWPASAGSAQATAAQSAQATGNPAECALNIGGQHIGILFGHGPSLPSACLIRKTEVRALMGGLILVAGGLLVLPGVVLLAAFAFRASGAARAAAQVVSVIPAGRAASGGARAAGAAVSAAPKKAAAVSR